jgi:hypothetical protein
MADIDKALPNERPEDEVQKNKWKRLMLQTS